jgi:hypothetical protein
MDSRRPSALERPPKRLEDPPKCLPVLFVVCVIITLYLIYVFWHCVPLLQLEKDQHLRDNMMVARGMYHLIIFIFFSTLLDICYIRSICTDPGEIPDSYKCEGEPNQDLPPSGVFETKRSGERRSCKWCKKYKPDRCHHCRICHSCILKMDHHCPWIYNCVGFKNHKFFFLLLFYTFCCTQLIFWTMFDSMMKALDEDRDFYDMFILLFGETLTGFLAILVSAFWGFHIWLMLRAMSTIEFCEKQMKTSKQSYASIYDRGVYGNIQEVLGLNPLLWFVPVADYAGDGLQFPITGADEGTRLTAGVNEGQPAGSRRPYESSEDAVMGPPPGTGTLA